MAYFQKYRAFFFFFLLVFLCNLLFLYWLTSYIIVVKPMIMASLIGFYISTAKFQSNTFLLGLIAALLGDIFLLFPGDSFFGLGLGTFLIMQLLYCIEFYKNLLITPQRLFFRAVPPFLAAGLFLGLTWQNLGAWQGAIAVYAIAISTMAALALLRNSNQVAATTVAVGSLLFMMSDLLLAFTKFITPWPGSSVLVMSTYMAAQFLIVFGISQASSNPGGK
jgi:uncharacterized membrane protein YhhN